jgi:hypothetical protein
MTKKQFGGRAITPQNLSDWKQAGHLDWLRRQEARETAFLLLQGADDLDEETTQAGVERKLSECFAKVFVVELTQAAMRLLEQERDVHKKWLAVCQINRELSRFRQGDQRERMMALRQISLARAEAREQSKALERARTRDRKQQEAKAKATATAKETAETTNIHPGVERPLFLLVLLVLLVPPANNQATKNHPASMKLTNAKWRITKEFRVTIHAPRITHHAFLPLKFVSRHLRKPQ